MAQRGGSSKKDDGMGCLFGMLQIPVSILILLFSSEDPAARKAGWGLVGAFVAFAILVEMGISGDVAFIITLVAVVVVIMVKCVSDGESLCAMLFIAYDKTIENEVKIAKEVWYTVNIVYHVNIMFRRNTQ